VSTQHEKGEPAGERYYEPAGTNLILPADAGITINRKGMPQP